MATNNGTQIKDDNYNLQFDDHFIFTAINEWEKHSIGKIQLTGQQARNDLKQLFDKKRQDFINSLSQIETNLSADINLNNWVEQLTKLRQDLSSYIHLEHDKNKSPIYLIKIFPKNNDQIQEMHDENITIPGTELLTLAALRNVTPAEQKQMLGERLFVLVQQIEPNLAAKITGMFLEFDIKYIFILIKSHKILKEKVKEAIDVLQAHQYKQRNMLNREIESEGKFLN